MSPRKVDDAEVQRIVHFNGYPRREVSLRKATEKWSSADFLAAIDRLSVDPPPTDDLPGLYELYRTLRAEREASEHRAIAEVKSSERHTELSRRIEELKRPHWSIAPNFWMTAAILILTAIGAAAAVLALFRA